MNQRASQSFRSESIDPTQAEPTANILKGTLSRIKAASVVGPVASSVASSKPRPGKPPVRSPLAQLFPVQADHAGQFGLVCEIASGGMATVYLGVDRSPKSNDEIVAVKRIHPHLAQDTPFAEMFIDEARLAAAVDHPSVCKVIDFGRTEHSYYIAMEYLHGESIAKLLAAEEGQERDPRTPRYVARIIANLAEGLYAAHTLKDELGRDLDVIHRDVTPHNLFVLYDGSVRITDFGIAWARHRLHQTEGQQLKGKLSYMSPEQLQRSELDHRVDLWALGVVLWEMLAGRKLFRCSSEGETVVEVVGRRIPKPSEHNKNVSPELDRIVLRCLARNRAERFATARELSQALEGFLKGSGEPVGAREIAAWMNRIFPNGAQSGREMLAEARGIASSMPRYEAPARSVRPRAAAPKGILPPAPMNLHLSADDREDTTQIYAPSRETLASIQTPLFQPSMTDVPLYEEAVTPTRRDGRRARSRNVAAVIVGCATLFAAGVSSVSFLRGSSKGVSASNATALVEHAAASKPAPASKAALTANAGYVQQPVTVSLDAALPAQETSKSPTKTAASASLANAPSAKSSESKAPKFAAAPAPFVNKEPGSAFISSRAGAADVFENGRLLGRLPGHFDFAPGVHTLVVKTGSSSQTMSINVAPGGSMIVNVPLSNVASF